MRWDLVIKAVFSGFCIALLTPLQGVNWLMTKSHSEVRMDIDYAYIKQLLSEIKEAQEPYADS